MLWNGTHLQISHKTINFYHQSLPCYVPSTIDSFMSESIYIGSPTFIQNYAEWNVFPTMYGFITCFSRILNFVTGFFEKKKIVFSVKTLASYNDVF